MALLEGEVADRCVVDRRAIVAEPEVDGFGAMPVLSSCQVGRTRLQLRARIRKVQIACRLNGPRGGSCLRESVVICELHSRQRDLGLFSRAVYDRGVPPVAGDRVGCAFDSDKPTI